MRDIFARFCAPFAARSAVLCLHHLFCVGSKSSSIGSIASLERKCARVRAPFGVVSVAAMTLACRVPRHQMRLHVGGMLGDLRTVADTAEVSLTGEVGAVQELHDTGGERDR